MDVVSQLVFALGLGWASGLRLYATILVVGLLGRLELVELPASLAMLEHDYVLWAAGIMTAAEFLADKLAGFDSIWDAVQTFLRIPGGALLAYGAMGGVGPEVQLAAALLGGALAAGIHTTKAGSRLLINHSPEPFSNVAVSSAEDSLWALGLALVMTYPWLFLGLLIVMLLLMAWLLPKLWRVLRRSWRWLKGAGRADRHLPAPPAPR